jgi:hypothetical protein
LIPITFSGQEKYQYQRTTFSDDYDEEEDYGIYEKISGLLFSRPKGKNY